MFSTFQPPEIGPRPSPIEAESKDGWGLERLILKESDIAGAPANFPERSEGKIKLNGMVVCKKDQLLHFEN